MASKQSVTAPAKVAVPATTIDASVPQQKLMMKLAVKYGVDESKMLATLKATAFRQKAKDGQPAVDITNEQMMMLAVVADQYNLNPFTREIYAFPSENGIVAIVSVDGWIRIINERAELDSIEFEVAPPGTEDPWISCTITRKDRSRPVTITEYLSECARATKPWQEMPRRMLRHKALIQCARVAFGFAGIFDPDEADRIISVVDAKQASLPQMMKPLTQEPKAMTVPTITVDQATALLDKINAEGIDLGELLTRFLISHIEELPAAKYPDAVAAIDELANG